MDTHMKGLPSLDGLRRAALTHSQKSQKARNISKPQLFINIILFEFKQWFQYHKTMS